jgi:hypothetical protein
MEIFHLMDIQVLLPANGKQIKSTVFCHKFVKAILKKTKYKFC